MPVVRPSVFDRAFRGIDPDRDRSGCPSRRPDSDLGRGWKRAGPASPSTASPTASSRRAFPSSTLLSITFINKGTQEVEHRLSDNVNHAAFGVGVMIDGNRFRVRSVWSCRMVRGSGGHVDPRRLVPRRCDSGCWQPLLSEAADRQWLGSGSPPGQV